jgi:hypothetical protein
MIKLLFAILLSVSLVSAITYDNPNLPHVNPISPTTTISSSVNYTIALNGSFIPYRATPEDILYVDDVNTQVLINSQSVYGFSDTLLGMFSNTGQRSNFVNYLATNTSAYPTNTFIRSRGSLSAPEALINGDEIGGILFRAFRTNLLTEDSAYIRATANGVVSPLTVPTNLLLYSNNGIEIDSGIGVVNFKENVLTEVEDMQFSNGVNAIESGGIDSPDGMIQRMK